MRRVLTVRVTERYGRAIDAVADLLTRLRIDFAFVGGVARAAWLGTRMEQGSLDILALMQPQQKNQLAMMASNRGFTVDREAIEQSAELDLVPIALDDIRIYILVASNALYGRMVAAAVPSEKGKVVKAEDLALLMAVGEDPEVEKLMRLPEFDRRAYNERLIAIGLQDLAVRE
jgi:hypothetical protein